MDRWERIHKSLETKEPVENYNDGLDPSVLVNEPNYDDMELSNQQEIGQLQGLKEENAYLRSQLISFAQRNTVANQVLILLVFHLLFEGFFGIDTFFRREESTMQA
jgi:hypothetical protein